MAKVETGKRRFHTCSAGAHAGVWPSQSSSAVVSQFSLAGITSPTHAVHCPEVVHVCVPPAQMPLPSVPGGPS